MKKRVLFVNLRLTAGGSERVMALLANGFADRGIDTEMLILKEENITYEINDKVKLTNCFCPLIGNKIIWHFRRIWSIRKAIIDSGADTIISFMWDINMNVILACLGLKKKIVISERADPRNESRKKTFSFANRWIFPLADLIVFQTNEVKEVYSKKCRQKSVVIPNPVNPVANKIDINMNDPVIVAAGRCTEQKNFRMLLQAFNIFYKNHTEYKLLVLGDGGLRDKLQREALNMECGKNVCFLGYVNDPNKYMQKASIFASSSNYEGISNSMMEALAMGLPAVCTDCPVGGAAMMIDNDVNGILVPVNDAKAMSDAFSKIADNKTFAEMLSTNSYNRSKDYTITKIVDRWLSEIGHI